jgi:hypothetical protein
MDMSTALANINWLAVIAAALSRFVIGGLWYSPALFSKAWMQENNFTDESMKANPPNMVLIFGTTFILALIACVNLAMFLGGPETDAAFGMTAGALIGIGWIATSVGTHYLFERKSMRHFLINAGYDVVAYIVMGLIIGIWR